jgi:hypothetical protein
MFDNLNLVLFPQKMFKPKYPKKKIYKLTKIGITKTLKCGIKVQVS